MRRLSRMLSLLGVAAFISCAGAPKLRGQLAALNEIARQAERNGAVRCAPRELAMAHSHLEFAQTELEQGFASKAENHLAIAEPNARAALFLSPPEHCVPSSDRDNDGLADPEDDCPDDPENYNGIEDEDGCPEDPDSDGDGILDSSDLCALLIEDRDGYLDEDGCPDVDNDADGLRDDEDTCPNEAEDPDGFGEADGCPDLDNDQDLVPDLDDQCPNEKGSSEKEPLGCPEKSLVVVTNCEVRILQQIHFAYNKATIRPISYPVLDAVVDVLISNPSIKLEVQGHTDNRGGADYNRELSQRRAAAVMRYLKRRGISAGRLMSAGYGFDRPLVPNDTADNRSLNRRVQFIRTGGTRKECE